MNASSSFSVYSFNDENSIVELLDDEEDGGVASPRGPNASLIPSMLIDPSLPLMKPPKKRTVKAYLVNLSDFKAHGRFPRFPTCAQKSTKINLSRSLVVFLSHAWIRKRSGEYFVDEHGHAHPDTKTHDKYNLYVQALDLIMQHYAPDMDDCYIWMDYCCLPQDGDGDVSPYQQLRHFDLLMMICDCMLTCVVDPKHAEWSSSSSSSSSISCLHFDYQAKQWKKYLSRAWCLLEMHYCCTIPLSSDYFPPEGQVIDAHGSLIGALDRINPLTGKGPTRALCLASGLAFEAINARRAHLLFGTREAERGLLPIILPHLSSTKLHPPPHHHHQQQQQPQQPQQLHVHLGEAEPPSLLDHFNPLAGEMSFASDMHKLAHLKKELKPYANLGEAGYEGTRDSTGTMRTAGRKHGHGRMAFPNGNVYEGDWDKDEMQGKGTFRTAWGDLYTGEMHQGLQHGFGKYVRADGSSYEGYWQHGIREGQGTYTWIDGSTYVGLWKKDDQHTYELLESSGVEIEKGAKGDRGGESREDKEESKKKQQEDAEAKEYKSEERQEEKEEEEYTHTQDAVLTIMPGGGGIGGGEGGVYVGPFFQGKRHGHGKMSWNDSSSYDGDWQNDVRQGQGTYISPLGSVYRGSWRNGEKCGHGEWRSGSGTGAEVQVLKGIFLHDNFLGAEGDAK